MIANHAPWDKDLTEDPKTTHVAVFEYSHHKRETLLSDVIAWIPLSDGQWLAYQKSQKRLRVMKEGERPIDLIDCLYFAG